MDKCKCGITQYSCRMLDAWISLLVIVDSMITSFYFAQLNAPKWAGMVDLRAELVLPLAAATFPSVNGIVTND